MTGLSPLPRQSFQRVVMPVIICGSWFLRSFYPAGSGRSCAQITAGSCLTRLDQTFLSSSLHHNRTLPGMLLLDMEVPSSGPQCHEIIRPPFEATCVNRVHKINLLLSQEFLPPFLSVHQPKYRNWSSATSVQNEARGTMDTLCSLQVETQQLSGKQTSLQPPRGRARLCPQAKRGREDGCRGKRRMERQQQQQSLPWVPADTR